jgi:hypothetical protein
MCSVCLHEKLENVEWEFTSIGITIEENNISGSFPAHYHNKCLDINWSRLLRSAILSLWYFRFEVTWLLRDNSKRKTWMRVHLNWNNHRRKLHFWLIFVKYFTLGWLNISFQIKKTYLLISLRQSPHCHCHTL